MASGFSRKVIGTRTALPSDMHAAVQGETDRAELKAFVARRKQFSGFHFKRQFGLRLWQRYSYERVIRGDEDTRMVVRYVLRNPIRAGLVERV